MESVREMSRRGTDSVRDKAHRKNRVWADRTASSAPTKPPTFSPAVLFVPEVKSLPCASHHTVQRGPMKVYYASIARV